jgi:hypothetical protein
MGREEMSVLGFVMAVRAIINYKCGSIGMISKLITSNQFREQVLRSFTLHRDFKACLSLK